MDCRTIAPWLLGGWCILIAAGDAGAQTAASFTVDAALPVAAGQPEIALLLDQTGEATLGVIRQGGTNTSAFGLHVSTSKIRKDRPTQPRPCHPIRPLHRAKARRSSRRPRASPA
jgi:hypothetical protein